MSDQGSDSAVDEVDVAAAWDGLNAEPRSQLVDVRTRAEWTYVGIPDLGPIGKRAVLGIDAASLCAVARGAVTYLILDDATRAAELA